MIQRPDAHAVVYVLEGDVEMQVSGGTPRRLGPGQKEQHAMRRKSSSD